MKKYKVIATTVVLLIIFAALALRGCSSAPSPAVNEYGEPIETQVQEY